MAIDINSAINAYNSAAEGILDRGSGSAGGASRAVNAGNSDFANAVEQFAKNAVETGHQSEKLSAAAAAGQADLNQVVVAVAEAELTLNTVVAVRDRVIQAYQSIIRMPI